MNTRFALYKTLEKNLTEQVLRKKVFEWLQASKLPIQDADYHKFSDSLGIDPSQMEAVVYNILAEFLQGEMSQGKIPDGADPEQIKKGMKVEMEHTDIPQMARKIVADHLTEDLTYYDKLEG